MNAKKCVHAQKPYPTLLKDLILKGEIWTNNCTFIIEQKTKLNLRVIFYIEAFKSLESLILKGPR